MGLAIVNNSASLNAQRNLQTTQEMLGLSISRLSAGLRVNAAQNDAAGLGIAERLRAQASGLSDSLKNANNEIKEVQTRDTELNEVSQLLNRMLELRTQSDSGNLNAQESEALAKEFEANNNEINRIADGNNLLAYRPDYTAAMGTRDGSLQSAEDIRKAMNMVTGIRSDLGARQSAMQESIGSLQSSGANPLTSRPRIDDAGDAAETAQWTRAQMLQQAGVAVLSQANAMPQLVAALLRG
ncbi:MAG: flagellin [Comamonas sp.]|uniref:flagellin N-terminal helical domain-containing protein n=1 Tax=Comamonas sp. TaxID=34028 RepID=UPI002FC789DE